MADTESRQFMQRWVGVPENNSPILSQFFKTPKNYVSYTLGRILTWEDKKAVVSQPAAKFDCFPENRGLRSIHLGQEYSVQVVFLFGQQGVQCSATLAEIANISIDST
ncbi:hypothetical protein OUZ56_009711 [Daphnia magna]|uniref:Uncharacterized protein n=1 Tax=Daphnia magna TaxID=35525 RepID=A0ABR0AGW8_9CRUS|nr:hypothetical protein OUZ56_009711 [Daphnia magna]